MRSLTYVRHISPRSPLIGTTRNKVRQRRAVWNIWGGRLDQTGLQGRVTPAELITADNATRFLGNIRAGCGIDIIVAGPGATAPESENTVYAEAFSARVDSQHRGVARIL